VNILLSRIAVVALVVSLALPSMAADAPAAAAAVDGKDLYVKKCAMCHGQAGAPSAMGKGSPSFNDPVWQSKTTDEAITQVTLGGRNKMPKFEGKLTPEQVQALVLYVRKLAPPKAD